MLSLKKSINKRAQLNVSKQKTPTKLALHEGCHCLWQTDARQRVLQLHATTKTNKKQNKKTIEKATGNTLQAEDEHKRVKKNQ